MSVVQFPSHPPMPSDSWPPKNLSFFFKNLRFGSDGRIASCRPSPPYLSSDFRYIGRHTGLRGRRTLFSARDSSRTNLSYHPYILACQRGLSGSRFSSAFENRGYNLPGHWPTGTHHVRKVPLICRFAHFETLCSFHVLD